MFKRIHSLSNRLTLSYAGAFALFLLIAFAVAYATFSSLLNARLIEDLEEDLEELRVTFSTGGLEETLTDIDNELKSSSADEVFFRIVDNNNELFLSDDSQWGDLRTGLNAIEGNRYPLVAKIQFDRQEYPAQVIVGYLAKDGPLLYVGESTEQNADILEILFALFLTMAILVLPIAYGVGWWVSQRAVKGINAVSSAASDIEHGNLSRRVEFKGAGLEIQRLGDHFNAMAHRIHQLVTEMREMTDSIAHDLRSPITRIRATAETLSHTKDCQQGALHVMHECDELIQLINTTLDVSEAEAGVIQGEKEVIDLGQLVQEVCELYEPAIEERHLTIERKIGPATVYGFRRYLQRLVANLLDNAVKYTPSGGTITVSLSNGSDQASLVVADTGIGIGQKDIERVFDRFYRADQTRQENGSGLGLSFCRAVMRTHKGSINVTSEVGKGSQFTLIFPVSA